MPKLADPPLIVMMTDMGESDWFVGTMKGVILSVCPQAQIVDLCHRVRHQSVQEAAFMLHINWKYFPKGSIFLCVVDPGVGTERHPLIARNDDYYFIAPNNGLLSYVMEESSGWEFLVIENQKLMLQNQSTTFHGRDVFSPAAGHLAAGHDFEDFGKKLEKAVTIPPIQSVKAEDNSISGRIIYIDSFGNLMTNIKPEMIPDKVNPEKLMLNFHGHLIQGIAPHFAAVPINHPLLYWGSSGYLEIAMNYGSAARKWHAQVDEWFELSWN
ncbi:MAG: S-adenosyl-l-methionine hydroxide adenosyltransferase family protein [Candidatus Sumerlaeia bacterium]